MDLPGEIDGLKGRKMDLLNPVSGAGVARPALGSPRAHVAEQEA